MLRNASDHQDLNRQVLALSAQVADTDREFVVGPSRAMREVMDLVQRIARLSATVLVLGESGTGKELVARLVHRSGERPDGPFIPVNLAAIPRDLVESTLFGHEKGAFTGAVRQQLGKFELAAGGTLFLDEIGDLRLDLQGKLLRAVQEGEIERVGGERPIRTDFRLIAATNVDLEKAVKEGRFREDLYYRLNVIPLRMPPLRERLEDLPELMQLLREAVQHALPAGRARRGARRHEAAAGALVAGEHPRTGEPRRTRRRHHRQGVGDRGGPALRVPDAGARAGGG